MKGIVKSAGWFLALAIVIFATGGIIFALHREDRAKSSVDVFWFQK